MKTCATATVIRPSNASAGVRTRTGLRAGRALEGTSKTTANVSWGGGVGDAKPIG